MAGKPGHDHCPAHGFQSRLASRRGAILAHGDLRSPRFDRRAPRTASVGGVFLIVPQVSPVRQLTVQEVIDGLETPLRLTAIALLLRPAGPWFVRPGVLAIAVLVLISPRVLRAPLTWVSLALLTVIRIADDLPLRQPYLPARVLVPRGGSGAAATEPRGNPLQVQPMDARARVHVRGLVEGVLADFVDGRFFRVTLLPIRVSAMRRCSSGVSRRSTRAGSAGAAAAAGGAER